MSGRPGNASLAQLIKEHGDRWVIEHTGGSTAWGHRSAISTRKGGAYYGYKLHLAICTRTELRAGADQDHQVSLLEPPTPTTH